MIQSGKLPSDSHEIQLHPDGSWTTLVTVKKEKKVAPVSLNRTIFHAESCCGQFYFLNKFFPSVKIFNVNGLV